VFRGVRNIEALQLHDSGFDDRVRIEMLIPLLKCHDASDPWERL